MDQTMNKDSRQSHVEDERAHAKSALLLTVVALLIIALSICLAISKTDPHGVYVYAYELDANGTRHETDKNTEFHLQKGGVATYVSAVGTENGQSLRLNGSWKKDGDKIILTFRGEQTVFRRSGNKLIEELENGRQVVYIKD